MKKLLLACGFCALLAGCATSRPSRSYQVLKPPGEEVVVISAKHVRIPSDSLTAVVVGAAAGSLLGPKIVALQSRVKLGTGLASVAGTVGGGFAAPYLFASDGLEIVARRSNGEKIAIVQPRNDWTPMIGQVALLVSTESGPRIVPD